MLTIYLALKTLINMIPIIFRIQEARYSKVLSMYGLRIDIGLL